ncbi:unnamed protein product, partial [Pylaiella littoralis]
GHRKRRLPKSATASASAATAVSAAMTAMLRHRDPTMWSIFSNQQLQPSKHTHSSSSSSNCRRKSLTIFRFSAAVMAAATAIAVEAGTAQVAAAAEAAGAVPWWKPFVDDGMFDPRREYWGNGNSNRTDGGVQSTVTTKPARSDWVAAAHGRGLASSSANCGPMSSSDPCCIECFGLSYCDVLNGRKVEDKYFPGEPTILGSCENFEDRASRLEVFGPSKTFRDTDACREMVIDYTCMWWGSENEMYDNRCGIEAQVPPCRSFCVQLAKTCANNVMDWQELCRSIDCPPTDEECMPGPYTQASNKDRDEACYLYEYHSPLNAAVIRGGGGYYSPGTVAVAAAALVVVV